MPHCSLVIASGYLNNDGTCVPIDHTNTDEFKDLVVATCSTMPYTYSVAGAWVSDHHPHATVAPNGFNCDKQVAGCKSPRVRHRRHCKHAFVGHMAGTCMKFFMDEEH